MLFALQYAALAGLGLVCGYVAHRLVTSPRSSLRRRLRLDRQLDGLAMPGLALAVFFAQRLSQPPTLGAYAQFGAAFMAPFLLWRVATHHSLKRGAKHHEDTLAFEVWYELLDKQPARAHEFIESYLVQEARLTSVSARVLELQAACEFLERGHAGDRSLPGALAVLQGHIARLKQEGARSLGASPS